MQKEGKSVNFGKDHSTHLNNVQNDNFRYELSLICVIYNSTFEQIRKTIESYIMQEDIKFEIIVADDGSTDNHERKIEQLFCEFNFSDYKMIMNKENYGTVQNYASGLATAEGEFVKGLSPGDYLHNKHTMREWVDFLRKSGADWSFSLAIYYDKATRNPIQVYRNPQILKPYMNSNEKNKRWNYVVLNDIALGAAILSKTDIQRRYCQRLIEKGIKYAEDNMWRLMMFDGYTAEFYNTVTIYYEFGSGISTQKNGIWERRLKDDWNKTNEIMQEINNPDAFQLKMLKGIRSQEGLFGKLLIKGKFREKIRKTIRPELTPIEQEK